MANLSNGLQKWLGLDVSCRAADFCYDYICSAGFSTGVDEVLYFVCNVRNNLDSSAEVFSVSLFLQDIPIYFSTCKVRKLR